MSAASATVAGSAEPELKRRRLLDAGGPIENDETARQKMRDAEVGDDNEGEERTGFDPDDMMEIKQLLRYIGRGTKMSPMGYFAREGDLPMMRWLYVNGADTCDPEVPTSFPMFAAAVWWGDFKVCKWLYEHGAAKDIKRRTSNGSSPLKTIVGVASRRELSRWLILNGALCGDDGTGKLDHGVLKKDLQGFTTSRRVLLEWANEQHRTREAFLAFLMGTLPSPEYSPSSLRKLLIKSLLSERGAHRLLDSLPSDQYQQLWGELLSDQKSVCPVNSLCGSSGVLERIGDYVGIIRGREARIIHQLTEMLPELDKELDQQSVDESSSSSEEEDDSDESSEEDEYSY